MAEYCVETRDLRREYLNRNFFGKVKSRTNALSGLNISIKYGELFGIIGPNGAGKTTTIKILSTLLLPTSGSAFVLGMDVTHDLYRIRKRIGIVFGGERGLYNRVTGLQNLLYFSDLYGVPPSVSRKRVPELIEMVGLTGRENERVEKYSRGMKQRLHIARALVHDPELMFLDEPTIGLDPAGARDIRGIIKQLKKDGKSILLTTHYMFEADELCERIAVISKGNLVALDRPSGLKKQVRDITLVELHVYGDSRAVSSSISELPSVSRVFSEDSGDRTIIRIQTPDGSEVLEKAKVIASQNNVRIIESSIKEPTLEDAYLRMVEE
ncbi:MAG: ATP-binding cassette domain-containing protein [Candidatus Thermoplasmatota archaeon]|nr:ATP-binding cassette domain-containing protein [Candidatus Thermoplasmatota archaeon]